MAWIEQRGKTSWRVRYFTTDGTIGSISGFPTKKAAQNKADTMESEQRHGSWIDPAHGQLTLAEWVDQWLDALDVGLRTEENYRSKLRTHILPRWGTTTLADITGTKAAAWAKHLRHNGLADVTVSDTMKLFTLILADAVDDKLIPANPIRPRRRGRGRRTPTPEKIWATTEQILHITDQTATCYGPDGAILILTAAYTGARWGELVGLQRPNLHLNPTDHPRIVIDPHTGALHESNSGKLWLGPPKTPESARTIHLPAFLTPLLRTYLDTHDHRHVFVTPDGELHRRSNFSRRALRPAADGNHHTTNPHHRLQPIRTGLTFHGLRHTHKTWMIEDDIPEIAQSRRLGHKLPNKIQETYSHVTPTIEQRILHTLQQRWTTTLANTPTTNLDTTWRHPTT